LGYGLTQDLKWNELGIRLATVPALIWDYFRLQIIPYPLMIFHERPTLFGSPWAGIFWGMIFLFLFLLFLYRLFPFSKVGVFGGIWFLVTLLPILNIIPIPWPTVVERFSYIPSFGFVLMIGVAGNYLMNHLPLPPLNIGKRGWVKMFVGVLMIFSVLTVMRNRVWSDEILIWKDTVNKSPHFALGHMNLGLTYHERGELQEAESAYQKALTLTSSSPKLLHNFGRLYQDTGRPEKAFNLYQRLAAQGDAFPETYLNMAILFEEKKEPDQAVHFYEKALEKDPGYFKAHLRLGRLLEYQKNLEGALAHYREAIGIFPMRYKVYFDIAEVLRLLGRFNEAGEAFSQFIRRVPADQKGSKEYAYAQMRVNEILNKQP
jgi:tetratricopeptide (TPR) repeat protein